MPIYRISTFIEMMIDFTVNKAWQFSTVKIPGFVLYQRLEETSYFETVNTLRRKNLLKYELIGIY